VGVTEEVHPAVTPPADVKTYMLFSLFLMRGDLIHTHLSVL